MLVRLLRTISHVPRNPNRSLTWKIIDSVFLGLVVLLVVISLFEPFGYLLLLPWVVLVTCRSWYALPEPSKRARRRLKEQSRPNVPVNRPELRGEPDLPKQFWDPMGR